MNQKQIGIVILILGLLVGVLVISAKIREDRQVNAFIAQQGGSCYLADGTCLHEDRSYTFYFAGGSIAVALLMLGAYLMFFDRAQIMLAEQHLQVSTALRDANIRDTEDSRWNTFLKGFNEDERKVLSAVKDQDGIQQSTLRFRSGVSKSSLSLMLKSFEKKGIISRKEQGKTNQVFLRSWK